MKIAIYSRVSTKDKGQDVENQTLQLEDFCKRQGWEVVKRFTDYMSGKSDARPGLQDMFSSARRKEFDCLLFWSLDRLSREGALGTLQHLQRLSQYGVNYKSYTEQYIDSCGIFADAVIGIIATIAKQERIRISDRTKAGLQRTKANGTILGRPKLIPNKVWDLREQGFNISDIVKQTTYSESTVRRILERKNG
jgi:DNA invertase Pin-like site-specific DNA recombinase